MEDLQTKLDGEISLPIEIPTRDSTLGERETKQVTDCLLTLGIERNINRLPSIPTQPTISFESSTLSKDLETLLDSESYTDVSIPMDEGESLKAHKVILSARRSMAFRFFPITSQSIPRGLATNPL